jgi:hypothetical protein
LTETPPILLLFEVPESDLAAAFDDLVARRDDLFFYDHQPPGGSRRVMNFQGLQLTIGFTEPPEDLPAYKPIFGRFDVRKAVSALTIDFGHSLPGAARVPVIVRALLQFGAILAEAMAAKMVAWTPARLLSDPAYFVETVTAYVDSGVFPVLSTVDLLPEGDVLKSAGLAWFSGQEIELRGDGLTQSERLSRAVRVVHDIATNGPVMMPQSLPDLDAHRQVKLELSEKAELVFVNILSNAEYSAI